jgi:hypothetical protein
MFSFLPNRSAPSWLHWLLFIAASGLACLAILTPAIETGQTEWHIILPILAYALPVATAAFMLTRNKTASPAWHIGAYAHLLVSFVVPFLYGFVLGGRDNAPLAGKIVLLVGVVVLYGLIYWVLEVRRLFKVENWTVGIAVLITVVIIAFPYVADFSSRSTFANAIRGSSVLSVIGWLTFLGYGVVQAHRSPSSY